MRHTKILLSILATSLLAAGCGKEQEGTIYKPSADDAKEIHFIQSSLTKEFPQGSKSGILEIEIARPGNKGELSVGLQKKGENESAFNIPETVTLPDGSYSVTVPVEVNLRQLLTGSSLNATILISDRQEETGTGSAYVTQFSDKINLSVSFALEWEPYYRTDESGNKVQQTATYTYNAFYTGRDSGLKVEKAVGTNIFKVNDWASGVSFKFILNEDNTCTVPSQSIGYYNSNYNEYVRVSDMAEYTGNKAAYSSYPCTYDGNGNFSFYLIYFVSAGYFAQGNETLTFNGNEDKTPVVEISFDGIETTETGFKAPRLSFSKNEYTRFYKATVVSGDITEDTARQEEIRKALEADKKPGSAPVVTLYDDSSELWNVGSGNCTAVALAYDSTSTSTVLYMKRFTCDPDGRYTPKVNKFEWRNDPSNTLYSPYTTLFWDMQADNVVSLKYLCMRTDYLEYMVSNLKTSAEEIAWERGNEVNEEFLQKLVSEDGFATVFNTLKQGTSYTLCVCVVNEFGDRTFVTKTAETKGYAASDFDTSKNLQDFIGAYKATATVDNTSGSSSGDESFRVDIYSLGGNDVMISGLSNTNDFTPEVKGYYDPESHSIQIEPQPLGRYKTYYVTLGLSDGLSIYWGGNSMSLGFIDGAIRMTPSPYSDAAINSYQFLLFTTEKATSASYTRQSVGSKTYSNLCLEPFSSFAPQRPASDDGFLGEKATLL